MPARPPPRGPSGRLFDERMALVADTIRAGVAQYQLCTSDFVAQTWWFSGQYAGIAKGEELECFQAWSEAFSTRANPALLATPALCNAAQFIGKENWLPCDEELDAAGEAALLALLEHDVGGAGDDHSACRIAERSAVKDDGDVRARRSRTRRSRRGGSRRGRVCRASRCAGHRVIHRAREPARITDLFGVGP